VQAIEKVDGARPGSRQTDPDLTGELRVRAGHEGGEFLVAGLDELDAVFRAIERTQETVDAVPRKTEDPTDSPFMEAIDDEVAYGAGHRDHSSMVSSRGARIGTGPL